MRRAILILALLVSVVSAEAKKVVKRDSITIFGRVLCEGKPLADVPVSDGVHIVKTDSLGRYAIASHKWHNTVFVITPSGYEPECNKRILPQFWALLKKKREVAEQHDFHLCKREQSNHRIIFMSNTFLHNSNDDLLQFKKNTIPAASKIGSDVKDSTAVYTIHLGDISNCPHWYSREFDVGDAVSLMASLRYPTMLYTVMGDQDNDGAIPGTGLTDYKAERQYVYSCGPKFYSMNIGDIHYVVLDNTVFRNEAGKGKYPPEIVGKRNYDRFVTTDQLDWLRKDLALITDKSKPVVVCMHHNTFATNSKNRISKRLSKPEDVDSITNCFADFKNVHFVTSGSNDREVSRSKELPHIVEHAVASTSGDRWHTGYNGHEQINQKGVPAGFEIFDVEGSKIKWRHISDKCDSKPFRVYDMAKVGEYYRENLDIQNLVRNYQKTIINYAAPEFAKFIYVNWWGDDPGAKLEVFEDNKPLRVRQIWQADPQFVVTSTAVTLKHSRNKPRFGRNNCPHLYRVQRTSPTSTIRVRTTDSFGVVHEEIIAGSKPFMQ
ncbi:MAG: calcineurin-like phosphoesterase C-terminal domain-containing protein [Alistipes sp.]|nr:calcineurin-like phosphoesterase C-terminal domain-containing protein [Alistipes sp.]